MKITGDRGKTCLPTQVIYKLLNGNSALPRPKGFGVQTLTIRHNMLTPATQHTPNVESV